MRHCVDYFQELVFHLQNTVIHTAQWNTEREKTFSFRFLVSRIPDTDLESIRLSKVNSCADGKWNKDVKELSSSVTQWQITNTFLGVISKTSELGARFTRPSYLQSNV